MSDSQKSFQDRIARLQEKKEHANPTADLHPGQATSNPHAPDQDIHTVPTKPSRAINVLVFCIVVSAAGGATYFLSDEAFKDGLGDMALSVASIGAGPSAGTDKDLNTSIWSEKPTPFNARNLAAARMEAFTGAMEEAGVSNTYASDTKTCDSMFAIECIDKAMTDGHKAVRP